MSDVKQREVVPLVGPQMPADQGLASLGLIMQLAGALFGAITAMLGIGQIISFLDMNQHIHEHGAGDDGAKSLALWTLIIAGTGVARALAHRAAGATLIYGERPFADFNRYLGLAALNIAAWMYLLIGKLGLPLAGWLPTVAVMAAWPITLAILMRLPRYRAVAGGLPVSEDKGFEGAAVLMTLFGTLGLLGTCAILYMLTKLPSEFLSSGQGVLTFVTLLMLALRSFLHVRAGWKGLNETALDSAVEASNRYADFGVIAAFVGGAAILLMMMMTTAQASGLVFIAGLVWMLLAWPMAIRRFFGERQFADLMAGDGAPVHRRAPDLGLTSLGWLLLAMGVLSLAEQLPAVLVHGSSGDGVGLAEIGLTSMTRLVGMLSPNSMMHSPWWNVGISGLELWAGIELVRMKDGHRLATTVYGVVATGVTIYLFLPLFEHFKELTRGRGLGDAMSQTLLISLALALVLPVGALLLVNRAHTPTARARLRSRE